MLNSPLISYNLLKSRSKHRESFYSSERNKEIPEENSPVSLVSFTPASEQSRRNQTITRGVLHRLPSEVIGQLRRLPDVSKVAEQVRKQSSDVSKIRKRRFLHPPRIEYEEEPQRIRAFTHPIPGMAGAVLANQMLGYMPLIDNRRPASRSFNDSRTVPEIELDLDVDTGIGSETQNEAVEVAREVDGAVVTISVLASELDLPGFEEVVREDEPGRYFVLSVKVICLCLLRPFFYARMIYDR